MKHLLISIAVLSLMGCANSAPSFPARSEPTPAPVTPESPSVIPGDGSPWTLHYTATCPTGAPENCLGAYGFSVESDGQYVIGPGPTGQTLQGRLKGPELKQIIALLSQPLAMPRCVSASLPTEYVNWVGGGNDIVFYRSEAIAEAHECEQVNLLPLTHGDSLRALLRALVAVYSPPVFPNPCANAISDLEAQYDSIQYCRVDSDCSYVNHLFVPADPNRGETLTRDDCTYLRPLLVANTFEATASQLEFLTKRELVQSVCGAGIRRPSCSAPIEFTPINRAPLCLAGKCRVNPTFDALIN